MPANLPPQFFQLQEKLKKAESNEEKISILQEMLSICPKHKGTEKVQLEIKRKIAKLKREEKKVKTKKQIQAFTIKKEGAGQVVIIGPPNSGKTSLVNALTGAEFRVENFPFTTSLPQPAMLKYENLQIQLVDTPPITKEFFPGWLKSLIKNADLILVLLDGTSENLKEDFENFKKILDNLGIEKEKTLFFVNKRENLNELEKNLRPVFLKDKFFLENLKKEIFEKLKIVRVYTKMPNSQPDFNSPFVLKKGTKLIELAEKISTNLAKKFKFAKLFKKDLKKPLIVGKDYIFEDGDVIEIH